MATAIQEMEMVQCAHCKQRFLSSEIIKKGDEYFCRSCGVDYHECRICGKVVYSEDMYSDNDDYVYCEDCYNEYTLVCDLCGDVYHRDEMSLVYDEQNREKMLCQNCLDENTLTCYSCNDVYLREALVTIAQEEFCYACAEHYYECASCRTLIHSDDAYFDDEGEAYCSDCYDDHAVLREYHSARNDERVYEWISQLYQRGYKRHKMFFGFELEVEVPDNDSRTNIIQKLQDKYPELEDILIFEEDGSLHHGFEIKILPMPYEEFMYKWVAKFEKLFETLRHWGIRSFDTDTCGLHFHFSKAAIGILTQYKIMKFVWNHPEQIIKLAQRPPNNHWNFDILGSIKKVVKKEYIPERYLAVNLLPEDTIEFRFNKGTLKYGTFLRKLELCYTIILFCQDTSYRDLKFQSYLDYLKKHHFTKLYSYILLRLGLSD